MNQAHYFSLPTQGNIYSHVVLEQTNGDKKLLIGTLERQIYYLEYEEKEDNTLIPTVMQLSFTYIPSDAEIISMDGYNKSKENDDFVIGVTIVKCDVDLNVTEYYLNIYSQWEKCNVLNIENIAQNCLNVELNFVPYQLTHTDLVHWTDENTFTKETVFLLTGSDNQIHIYRENESAHIYKEMSSIDVFPEFKSPPSIVMWIEIRYFNNYTERITTYGCECGYLKLMRWNLRTKKMVFNFHTKLSSICKLIIYEENENNESKNHILKNIIKNTEVDTEKEVSPNLNLIVISATLAPVIFNDILNCGLSNQNIVNYPRNTFITTCGEAADINFDGKKEVIIGSSSQEVYFFEKDATNQWIMIDKMRLVSPIFQIRHLDLTGDGVNELIVFTMKGVYIFQHKHEDIEKAILDKLAILSIPKI